MPINSPCPSPRHKTVLPPLLAAALAVAGLLFPCTVWPAQTTWTDSTGNGLWSDGANWDMGEPTAGAPTIEVIFPTPIPSGNSTISLGPGEREIATKLMINDDYILAGGELSTVTVTVGPGVVATINSTILTTNLCLGLVEFGLQFRVSINRASMPAFPIAHVATQYFHLPAQLGVLSPQFAESDRSCSSTGTCSTSEVLITLRNRTSTRSPPDQFSANPPLRRIIALKTSKVLTYHGLISTASQPYSPTVVMKGVE